MFEKIKTIIADQLGIDNADELTLETSLKEDLDADSLDAVEVIMALEHQCSLRIPYKDEIIVLIF